MEIDFPNHVDGLTQYTFLPNTGNSYNRYKEFCLYQIVINDVGVVLLINTSFLKLCRIIFTVFSILRIVESDH